MGAAVLLVSADLNEILQLSDSLMVFNSGRIVAYFDDVNGLDDVSLGEFMLGIKSQNEDDVRKVCYEE